jgi:NAD(P)-dependent dehydrogenase (short-subunit alcohol dehydrogenase family)
MSDKEWDQITEVHLRGAFACTKAAWPIFRKQKFGRVINTASAAGIYGECAHFFGRGEILSGFVKATLARPTTALRRWVSLASPRLLRVKVPSTTSSRQSSLLCVSYVANENHRAEYHEQMAASAMTETIMPAEMLKQMSVSLRSDRFTEAIS